MTNPNDARPLWLKLPRARIRLASECTVAERDQAVAYCREGDTEWRSITDLHTPRRAES